MDNAIVYEGVEKSYDGVKALKSLNLSIPSGTIFGLLGPNGAGKTTLIRMTMQIILPDSGKIIVKGEELKSNHQFLIGYLPEERGLYPKMKVGETIEFYGNLKGLNRKEAKSRAGEWLERVGLLDWKDHKVQDLSKGMQQKIQFIITVIHDPSILILDEPFAGLDPVNVDLLKDIILDIQKKGTTIIFSTHQMEQVERLCKNICLINHGEKVLDGETGDIKKRFGRNQVHVAFEGTWPFDAVTNLVIKSDVEERFARLELIEGSDTNEVLKRLLEKIKICKFETAEASIHDIFVKVVENA